MEQRRRMARTRQRGAAALEFALVLIPLLVLAFGVVEYGRTIYYYDTVVKSVRAAARYIAPHDPADAASFAVAASNARCLAVYGKTACGSGDTPLVPGLSTANVKVCSKASVTECTGLLGSDVQNVSTGTGTGTINLVIVRVEGYQFGFLGLPFTGAGTSVQFNAVESVMRGI